MLNVVMLSVIVPIVVAPVVFMIRASYHAFLFYFHFSVGVEYLDKK
jgi:hypothetical protein